MAISKISNPRSILKAIEEYDLLGEKAFHQKYGYRGSRDYFLFFKGKYYPSKGILGVAYSFEYPGEVLSSDDFSGGRPVESKLRELGFQIVNEMKVSEVEKAIVFILEKVIEPALSHPEIDESVKAAIINTKVWVERFVKIGDLYLYLSRFNDDSTKNKVYIELHRLGLKTFEDVFAEFRKVFGRNLKDITKLTDFIIGNSYTAFDVAIFSKAYNNQRGIHLIEDEDGIKAVFLKVSFDVDSKYKNIWLIKNKELKYYLYSHNGKFDEGYKQNKAIIDSSSLSPLYVFLKESENNYLFDGIYQLQDVVREQDDSKWFKLLKKESTAHEVPISHEKFLLDYSLELNESKIMTSEQRLKKISELNKEVRVREVTTKAIIRNPYVVEETLFRANGKCERCTKEAPFLKKNGGPYLEVHHLIQLSQGGLDDLSNTLAVCPNCHRELHFGHISDEEFIKLKLKLQKL